MQFERHDDRAGEARELQSLVLPGAAVIAGQVRKGLELRVGVRRQQFAMGVDVDPLSFGGLQKCLEILQVMAGRQDRLAAHGRHAHHRGLRHAERAGVGGFQGFHDRQIEPAEFQRLIEQGVAVGRATGEEHQRALHPGGDGVAFIAEHLGMEGVGADALEPEENQRAQADNVLPDRALAGENADIGRLGQHALHICGRFKPGRAGQGCGGAAQPVGGACGGIAHAVAHRGGLLDQRHEAGRIEVDVGQRREHGVQDEAARLLIHHAELPGCAGMLCHALDRVEQQILQIGGGGVFSALAFGCRAAVSVGGSLGLFALVAEHAVSFLEGFIVTGARNTESRHRFS